MPGSLLAMFLIFVARPLAVTLTTAFDRFSGAEVVLLSWAGLRGGVPVVLATLPVIAHVPGSLRFFNIVFLVVLISTLVQGTTFEPLARRLGLATSDADAPTGAAPASPARPPAARPPVPRPAQEAWAAEHGNPAHPVRLHGVSVVEHLRSRKDSAGALVRLRDGRHAITGATLTLGHAADLGRYVAERLARAADERERIWWLELAAALERAG
jgi:cell volume regulation protein A